MNLLQLVFKQMRQRALSTWLTMLAVLLGVALAVAIMITMRGSEAIFGQNDFGYDVIVGAKGSPLQLTLNSVYHLDKSPGNIAYSLYEKMLRDPAYRPLVRIAVPTAVGDSYKNRRIVGTLPKMFGLNDDGTPVEPDRAFEYRPGKHYEIADGKVFGADKFEAVIGSEIPRLTGLKMGDEFQATHGIPQPGEQPDIHKPRWKVVGILKPTHTASDGVVYIPLTSFYCIAEHDVGLVAQEAIREGKNATTAVSALQAKDAEVKKAANKGEEEEVEHYTVRPDGTIDLQLPKDIWGLSAILVRSRSPFAAQTLMYNLNNGREAGAVNPASTMREFFDIFLRPSMLLLQAVSWLVLIVAAVGILVSIYNSVSARKQEIAILRALGATRGRIVTLLCVEAGLIGLFGGILGIFAGHLVGVGGSMYMEQLVGEGLPWLTIQRGEWIYLIAVVGIAVLAGLAPALKAYRTPVATNLVAG
jgi:putative ABC transport system permease protein